MSERKTIKINPDLFGMGAKTKKNKEKKQLPSVKPLISPNTLKNKLLKRIKEHKNTEIDNESSNNTSGTNSYIKPSLTDFSDEFYDSLDYLNKMSKQKKVSAEKENHNKNKREHVLNKTLKNPFSAPHVNLDLPEELREPIKINTSLITFDEPMNLKYKIDKDVPYGCLKGGYKPTYKGLNKTQRNYEISSPSETLTIVKPQLNFVNNTTEREKKLNQLKDKLKQKQTLLNAQKEAQNIINNNVALNRIAKPILNSMKPQQNINNLELNLEFPSDMNTIATATATATANSTATANESLISNDNYNINNNNIVVNNPQPTQLFEEKDITPFKRNILKRTIKRKYKVGKYGGKIGVLIKDKNTRKNILNAQRELRKKPISDVKTYLHGHGLIKIGSNAPNDVIRKIYEYSMLAGEINNNSSDVLMHNFMKDKSEQ